MCPAYLNDAYGLAGTPLRVCKLLKDKKRMREWTQAAKQRHGVRIYTPQNILMKTSALLQQHKAYSEMHGDGSGSGRGSGNGVGDGDVGGGDSMGDTDFSYLHSVMSLSYPAVLKPLSGAGSHLVTKISSFTHLIEYMQQHQLEQQALLAKYPYWNIENVDQFLMLEEFIGGSEVDVDVVVERGQIKFLAISDNFPTEVRVCGCKWVYVSVGVCVYVYV